MNLKGLMLKSLGWLVLSGLLASPALAKLSLPEINSIARQTTVLIAPGLTPELQEEIEENRNNPVAANQEGVWNPGSGVIIAKTGNKYYVLTVAHNFPQRHLDRNIPFGIRTSDREIHVVTEINDRRGCPLQGNGVPAALIRFGCRSRSRGVRGIDIAIVSFESNKNYAVASLGDASQVKEGDVVYISGWPDPEKELDPIAGRCRGRVVRRQRRLAWGEVEGKLNPDPDNLGYSIFYTDNTRAGMSGGPVFDSNGRLVGNHGIGSSTKARCGSKPQIESLAESDAGTPPENLDNLPLNFNNLSRWFSGSQQVNQAVNLLKQIGFNVPFNLEPPSKKMIRRGMRGQEMQAIAARSGRIEFDARSDGFEDPNDVVENIYQLYEFGLPSQIRDIPSGGCGSVLLGDREEECGF